MKATHFGTCQVCGCEQKLPKGVLSKHGYSVKWGFFSGVCFGAGHQPFEKSKDLVDEAIARAKAKEVELTARIAQLQQPATEPQATCHVYRSYEACRNRYEKPGYLWVTGRIEERAPRHGLRFVVIDKDEREWYIHDDRMGGKPSALEAATSNNRIYAKHLAGELAQVQDYIRWQLERIEGWSIRDLKPIS